MSDGHTQPGGQAQHESQEQSYSSIRVRAKHDGEDFFQVLHRQSSRDRNLG